MYVVRRILVFSVRTLAIIALLCASVQTTHRYFYCEAMGLLQTACVLLDRAEHDVALTPAHEDCCRVVTTPALPNATGAATLAVPHASNVAWAPALHVRAPSSAAHARPTCSESGRLPRRSEADLAKLADRIVALVKANAKGVNAETIKRTLKIERKELPRPLAVALGSKKITKRGKKRATMYFKA